MIKVPDASAYRQAEAYIYDIPKFTAKNSLGHTGQMLEFLGNPGMDKKIIHVAGTNGKGSVCAFLNSLLMEQGFATGMFISPHLRTMRERIMINRQMITEAEFYEAFCTVREAVGKRQEREAGFLHPTFFEFLFLMGMVVFEKRQVDVIVLETGLGGRKDATNVVNPSLSVITEIGLDHCQYLGDTKEKIAWEKAGIIKNDTPVVFLDKEAGTTEIIESVARKKKAMCYPVSKKDYHVEKSNHKNVDFSFHSRYYSYVSFTLSTSALYQAENVSLAVRAFEVFMGRKDYQPEQLRRAVETTKWEGRMEEVFPHIYVDGAHNMDGVEAFLETVRAHGHTAGNILLFGVVSDKAYPDMIKDIMASGLFDEIVITGMEEDRAVHAGELQEIFNQYTKVSVHGFERTGDALFYAKGLRHGEDNLYIAGSLYLVGEILPLLKEEFR